MLEKLESLSQNQRLALNIFVPLLYFIGLVVAWFAPKYFGFGYRPLVYIGLSVGLSGLLLWMLSMAHLGNALKVLPNQSDSQEDGLVARGVYRYMRHPLYVGITLTLFGLFLACGSTLGMIYLFVIVIPLNIFRANLEEKALSTQFGERYRAYRNKTFF